MSTEFASYLHEVFASFGNIQIKRMFGGFGVYHQGLMFALIADDILYLKANEDSKQAFEQRGLTPFELHRHDKIIKMSYYQAPEEIFDDFEQAAIWANLAYHAALQAKKPNKK